MQTVDLVFRLNASRTLPQDHGYLLYAALSRLLPLVHRSSSVAIHPIRGTQVGNRQLRLNQQSRLILRSNTGNVASVIQVAGKQLDIAGTRVRVGIPQVWALKPATALRSRLVVIKVKDAPTAADLNKDNFRQAARRQLDALGISAEAIVTLGKRRTLRIKDKEVVGYEVVLEGLSAEESLDIQENGLGGRRHMGCGVFVATTGLGETQT